MRQLPTWQKPTQAIISIRYIKEPNLDWGITDVRQPYPMDIAVWIRHAAEFISKHHWRLEPAILHAGLSEWVPTQSNDQSLSSWEDIFLHIEMLLAEVSTIITNARDG